MHPSFGIEYQCSSLKWEDVMRGPSREAVLAHIHKVLHYRELFGGYGVSAPSADAQNRLKETAPAVRTVAHSYARAA